MTVEMLLTDKLIAFLLLYASVFPGANNCHVFSLVQILSVCNSLFYVIKPFISFIIPREHLPGPPGLLLSGQVTSGADAQPLSSGFPSTSSRNAFASVSLALAPMFFSFLVYAPVFGGTKSLAAFQERENG